ncbi:MAG: hypothetical protein KGN36_21325, partial [Acidobacteriota bacterium]|nr:hypothetical protein [Acidobacteriota bacterium]
ALIANAVPLAEWSGMTLAAPAVRSADTGLRLDRPVTLRAPAPPLTLCGDSAVHFDILGGAMFSPDVYGDNVAIPPDQRAVRIGLTANAGAGVSLPAGSATFGLDASAGIEIACYRCFPAEGTAVLDALRQAVGGMVIPFAPEDLNAMAAGAVVTLGGSGSLKFSATANLLAMSNPLATLTLPSPAPTLAVTQGATVTAGASWTIACEYQLRVQKVDAARVRLGWYRRHSSGFNVTAEASAGISAGTTTFDLFSAVIRAIAADAAAEDAELQRAGLSAEAAGEIETAVTCAVSRKLEVAVAAEFGTLDSDEAAFLYEVDLGAMDEGGRAAVAGALRGDLSGLASPHPGIRQERSILTKAAASHFTLRVNLLGIFNYARVTRLALEGKVTWTPSTGELVIADQASATRIATSAVNFGADEDKLRGVMAESFLLTAVYRGSKTALAPPELKSTQSFFKLDHSAQRSEMERFARALAALHLAPPPLPAGVEDFGRTTLHLEAGYDGAATRALFLDAGGGPRAVEEYEAVGRLALQLLVPEEGDDSFRRAPAIRDDLWARMKELGNANFGQLFPAVQTGAIGADYLSIRWWADSMHGAAVLVAEILQPGAANSEDLRGQLARHLRQVVKDAHEEFGDPWGLVAMWLVAPQRAVAGGSITSARYVFSVPGATLAPRPPAMAASPMAAGYCCTGPAHHCYPPYTRGTDDQCVVPLCPGLLP